MIGGGSTGGTSPTASTTLTTYSGTVTTQSASQIVAANTNRRRFKIKNDDAVGVLYLCTVGESTADGIPIYPGEQTDWIQSTAAIYLAASVNPTTYKILEEAA